MSVGCPQRFVQDCLKNDGHGEALFYRLLFNIWCVWCGYNAYLCILSFLLYSLIADDVTNSNYVTSGCCKYMLICGKRA
jgi:hypothetical protein